MRERQNKQTTLADLLPSAGDSSGFDAAIAKLRALALAAQQEAPARVPEPSSVPRGVQVLTTEDVAAAVKVWEDTRQVPRHIATHPAEYLSAMVRNLNFHSAYPIRKQWYRVVYHVLYMTAKWPTEQDLMAAARDVVRDDAI